MMLTSTPAVAVGCVTMLASGMDLAHSLLNPAIWALCLLAVLAAFALPEVLFEFFSASVVALLIPLVGLGFALFMHGAQGVHRWLNLGYVQLNVAAILLPLSLVAMANLVRSRPLTVTIVTVTIGGLLAFQPDAGQSLAFTLASLGVCSRAARTNYCVFTGMILVVGFSVLAWCRPDPLPLVPHVDGILTLAAQISWVLYVAGVASLALLPVPFLVCLGASEPHRVRESALGLFIYISSLAIVPFFCRQPFPLLGWGASPVIGNALAIALLLHPDSSRWRRIGATPHKQVIAH